MKNSVVVKVVCPNHFIILSFEHRQKKEKGRMLMEMDWTLT